MYQTDCLTRLLLITDTLKRIEDRENVVGRDPKDTVGEEGETPREAQQATQSHDGHDAGAALVDLCGVGLNPLETVEPGQDEDEAGEGEDEDQRIVAYVDNVLRVPVRYPAPWNRNVNQEKPQNDTVY